MVWESNSTARTGLRSAPYCAFRSSRRPGPRCAGRASGHQYSLGSLPRVLKLARGQERRERSLPSDEGGRTPAGWPSMACAGTASDERRHMEKLLSVKEAADVLGCSEAAIRKWIHQRRLRSVKMGRLTRIRLSDIEDLLANGLR